MKTISTQVFDEFTAHTGNLSGFARKLTMKTLHIGPTHTRATDATRVITLQYSTVSFLVGPVEIVIPDGDHISEKPNFLNSSNSTVSQLFVEKSKSKQMPYVRLLLFLAWPAGKHSLH
jgi:hypothetical protein